MSSFLNIPIGNIKYFGPAAVKKFAKLKIKTVGDLLYHFPFRYDDFSNLSTVADLAPNSQATVSGIIVKAKNINIYKRRMTLTEITVDDGTGTVKSVWFNQPYLLNQFGIGRQINVSGKVALNKRQIGFSNPAYEIVGYGDSAAKKESIHTGRLVPIYPETSGLTSRWLRLGVKSLLQFADRIPDALPEAVKNKYNLPDIGRALRKIHFPETRKEAELAKRRFAFEELLTLQVFMALERLIVNRQTAPVVDFKKRAIKNFVDSLHFQLTDDQRKSAWQIIQDIGKNRPMNRLLEGDVGSGKTIVAAIAAHLAALNGFQAVFMAPTEILSRQHYEKIWPLFKKSDILVGLLTSSGASISGNKTTKKKLVEKIADGGASIVIGTHSLIQKNVSFKNLALAIIDEQHRFGVNQRAALTRRAQTVPHLLSMSATPIPRTLGLTIWGDLDLSLIKELPKGRKSITTKIVAPPEREQTYNFIKKEIGNGRQAFIICPLVEESEKLSKILAEGMEVKAVKKEYERLKKDVFPELKMGLLHGRLKAKEKEKVMAEFLNKNYDILLATSVVEVGIDVPNATVIMIESADRFGLASLYQFRGRVGRGEHQSYCFLLTDSPSVKTNERLKALESAQSGFDLAERDLAMRGPGEFAGVRQSGLPDLAIASLTDAKLVEETREAAKQIIADDASLKKYPILAAKIAEFKSRIHLE